MGSSGSGNPNDKPYVVLTLDDDDDKATAQLQAARAAGFEVLFAVEHFVPSSETANNWQTRVILGAYQGKS